MQSNQCNVRNLNLMSDAHDFPHIDDSDVDDRSDVVNDLRDSSTDQFSCSQTTFCESMSGISTSTTIKPSTSSHSNDKISSKPSVAIELDSREACSGEKLPLKSIKTDEYNSTGINIKFKDIIYETRSGLCWKRGKCDLFYAN